MAILDENGVILETNLAGSRHVADPVYLDGGSAANASLIESVEDEMMRDIHVLPHPQFTVAFWAALSI